MNELRMTFYEFESFKTFRGCISCHLQKVMPREHIWVETALNEAVNNAFKHGQKRKANAPISINMKVLNGKRLVIRVKDSGDGFCVADVLKYSGKYFSDEDLLDESGRGLKIMLQVMDVVKYNVLGNEVLLVKRLSDQEVI